MSPRIRITLLLSVLLPATGLAGAALSQWRTLDAAEVAGVLSGRTVVYEGVGWQVFGGAGRTVFRPEEAPMGLTSIGEWRVIADRYCQRWTRLADWACYRMDYDGADGIRFIDAMGNVSAGVFQPE